LHEFSDPRSIFQNLFESNVRELLLKQVIIFRDGGVPGFAGPGGIGNNYKSTSTILKSKTTALWNGYIYVRVRRRKVQLRK
jgi:hypothetical protein